MSQLQQRMPTSPLSLCMLIRYAVRLLHDDPSAELQHTVYEMLLKCLRHASDVSPLSLSHHQMVAFEAARAIVRLPDISENDVSPAVNTLQIQLGSSRTASRFAAVRLLHELSAILPQCVSSCNGDLEVLAGDSNRSIATIAISTLLRTVDGDR